MVRNKAFLLGLLILTIAVVGSSNSGSMYLVPRVHAANVSLELVGNRLAWNLTSPPLNPTITVDYGDNVTIKLTSTDVTHKFFVDVNNDTSSDCPSPDYCSNSVTQANPQTFSFKANFTAGTYTYYCAFHPYNMAGVFTVRAVHDVLVSGLAASRNVAYNSVTSNPVRVNVTAQNRGIVTDTFAVYAKANGTIIGNKTITLAAGATSVVSFLWNNTQSLARGVYVLTANATQIANDVDISNNQYAGGAFTVKFKGDVNGDCKVDKADLASVGAAFGKTTVSIGFNPNADLNNDGGINIVDLVLVAESFGQAC